MKKLLLIFTLLFSTLMFSTPSYGEWTKVSDNASGDSYYVDFERIRKHGENVYWWQLTDYPTPTKYGHLSSKIYGQGDCKLFRYKYLSDSYYNESMGRGTSAQSSNVPAMNWKYPLPDSVLEVVLNQVCSQ